MPKISIITAVYNAEPFIETYISTIKYQTFKDFELLLLDDCSTDKTVEILKTQYLDPSSEKYDPRIKLFQNLRNAGYAGANANRLLSLVDPGSKYIYMAGADDAMTENNLELLYNGAEKTNAEVVCLNSHYYTFDQNIKIPGPVKIENVVPRLKPRRLPDNLVDRLDEALFNNYFPAVDWMKLYRHDFIKRTKIYFPDVRGIDDFFFNFAQLCFAKSLEMVEGCGYIYRQNPNSAMHASAEKHIINTVRYLSNAVAYMEEVFASEHMIQPLSRENQLILLAYSVSYMIQERIVRYGMTLTEINEVLTEVTKEGSAIDPEITRALIQALTVMLSFHFYKKPDRTKLFQLIREDKES